jgi:hypothetical protein
MIVLLKALRQNLYHAIFFVTILLRASTDTGLYSDGILLGIPFVSIILASSDKARGAGRQTRPRPVTR